MKTKTRLLAMSLAAVLAIGATAQAQSRPSSSSAGTAVWTITGAGAGFGIGLWAGLTRFDDAINSDRKVWTTAIVGAAAGALGGYLIGRARARRSTSGPSSPSRSNGSPVAFGVPGPDRCRPVLMRVEGVYRNVWRHVGTCNLLSIPASATGQFGGPVSPDPAAR